MVTWWLLLALLCAAGGKGLGVLRTGIRDESRVSCGRNGIVDHQVKTSFLGRSHHPLHLPAGRHSGPVLDSVETWPGGITQLISRVGRKVCTNGLYQWCDSGPLRDCICCTYYLGTYPGRKEHLTGYPNSQAIARRSTAHAARQNGSTRSAGSCRVASWSLPQPRLSVTGERSRQVTYVRRHCFARLSYLNHFCQAMERQLPIPDLQRQSPAVDFIENDLDKYHVAFSTPPSRYDPDLGGFVIQSPQTHISGASTPCIAVSHEASGLRIQPRPIPQPIEALDFWDSLFPRAMDTLPPEQPAQEAKLAGQSIRNATT